MVSSVLVLGKALHVDAEIGRPVAGGRDLVGAGRVGAAGALGVPNHSSSEVSQPMPLDEAAPIWPRSIAGLSDRPTSWDVDPLTRYSPVSVSTITSDRRAMEK